MYYIPPIHAPKEFNRQLFGPGAQNAVEQYKNAIEDKKLIGLLMLFGSTDSIIHSFRVEGDINSGNCIGLNEKGNEIIKVPIKEPIIIREEYDGQRDVHRFSIT